MNWISVEDRLPKNCVEVLLNPYGTSGYLLGFYCETDEAFQTVNTGRFKTIREVTHWMPLPEPPENNQ